MNKNGKNNFVRTIAVLKKNVISIIIVICSVMILFTGTVAWLKRGDQSESIKTPGFSYRNNGTLIPLQYEIKTYYKSQNGTWNLITTDYEREDENKDYWSSWWDDMSTVLVPGKRTEFKTEIKNLTDHAQNVSVYLKDTFVETTIRDMVKIGVSNPEVIVYDCAENGDETIFNDIVTEDNTEWAFNDILCLTLNNTIPAKATYELDWYIVLGSDMDFGSFPVLCDKSTGEPITASNGGYYSVNEVDENDNVTEAFLCDEFGVLTVIDGMLTEYPGEYSQTKYISCLTGFSPYRVRISGMYVMVG